ncbi:shugoshin 1-like isoform X1 [Pezoporus occidentalis]|uniref:shugoshin 1-like isoform X1 n=1 Tax=Pezoporus occidentalis TaxID=407982 RepID=UPI002F91802F
MSERKMHRRSQASLKERVRKRNMKRTGLGKAYEPLSAGANGTSSHSVQLKSILANNRALARALQEEKLRVRRAKDAFLCLKGENQCLKFEIFYLEMLLQSWQMWASAENARIFPPVPLMIPVVTGQDHCVGVPQHIVEYEEFPESEMKATADDNKPAGCFSEDFCESASADAVKETDPERGVVEEMRLQMSII